MKRRTSVGFIAALLLSACSVLLPPDDGPGEASPGVPVEPTPNLNEPNGVAQTFLSAWEQSDLGGMYSLLSATSQNSFTLEEFSDWYLTTANTMTLESLTTQLNSELTQGNSAQIDFRVTYDTIVLGDIVHELTMLLVFDGTTQRWGVVWSPNLIFDALCNSCVLTIDTESPARANIYDSEGLWLAQQGASAVSVSIIPEQIGGDYEDDMLFQLSTILRQTPEDLKKQYEGFPANWELALGDTDLDTFNQNRGLLESYPPLRFSEKSGRRTFNALAPHILGYTGFIPADQCDEWKQRGYSCDSIVGVSGLEQWGEATLAGSPRATLSVYTESGGFVADVAGVDAVPSQSIHTTIDRRLQSIVQNALQEAFFAAKDTWAGGSFPSPGAAAVVIDIDNGNILAMASYPDFDPNVFDPTNPFIEEIRTSRINSYFSDYRKPFLNRPLQGEYPPGSVFKVVTMAAALGQAGYNVNTQYTCNGFWDGLGVDNRKLDWLPTGHGTITLAQALTFSCDPFFYDIGFNTGNIDFNMIPDFARGFGLGEQTGLGQLEEASGLIPDDAWMVQNRGREWSIADSVNIAIGQGDVLVTPLQVANMFAAIANGGTLYKPQIVSQISIIGEEPSFVAQPEVAGTLPITPDNLAVMQQSLWNVSTNPGGTAQHTLRGSSVALAGKTGTAQAPGATALPHAWFAGYAPADVPEIAIAVIVENAGEGSNIAAPIFRRIAEEYFRGSYSAYPDFWYNPEEYALFAGDLIVE